MKKDITTLRLDLVPVHDGPADGERPLPRLRVTDVIQPPEGLFVLDGKNMLIRANLHTVKGKMKAGKSALGLVLMAAALGGCCLGIRPRRDDLSIVWIDTEQDQATLQMKMKAVLRMAGLPDDVDQDDRLAVYPLRGWGTPSELLEATVRAFMENEHADLIFLDGVVDVCSAFNDEEASRETVSRLEKIIEKYGVTILTNIHTNKGDDNARGHLGALVEQKSAEVYEVVKADFGIATVKQTVSRYGEVSPFSFAFQDDFTLAGAVDPAKSDGTIEEVRRLFEPLFQNGEMVLDDSIAYRYTDLYKSYKDYHGVSERLAKSMISKAVSPKCGVLEKTVRPVRYRLRSASRDFDATDDDPL